MTVNKRRKKLHEEPAHKTKKVKSSGSQTAIKTEERIQAVTEAEDDHWFETKTKVRKKEGMKEDDCSDQLNLKKKNKKRKVSFELPKEKHSEDLVYVEGHEDLEQEKESEVKYSKGKMFKKKRKEDRCHASYASLSLESKQNSDVELSNFSDDIQENKFAFAKSRRNNALNLKLDSEVTKKKKEDISSLALVNFQDSEYKQSQKDCKGTNVHTSGGRSITGESHGTDTIRNDGKDMKERKKKKSDSFLPLAGNQNNISAVHYSPIALSDFGRRHGKEIRLTDKEEKDTTENPESIRKTKKKKNKSKEVFSLKCKDDQCYNQRVLDEHHPTLQEVESEEKDLSGRKIWKKSKNNNEAIKKKKKRKIQKDKETTFSEVSLSNDYASKSRKIMPLESNKERKMKTGECATGDTAGDRVLCKSDHMLSDKKRKEVPEDSAEESKSNASIKKKSIKIEDRGDKTMVDVDDVIVVQGEKGNSDEINTGKVRRQALQEEFDRESGKTNIFSPKVNVDTTIGQWSTAAFQSSERGMKFLRLMGAFKKGSAPVEDLSVTTNKPNMALNREGEEKLEQALKMEFDKAMDLKQHRKTGLGFQPAANKKVYIDKYASRSIKFED